MDCSLPAFSVHGIFQARVLEWVAISFSKLKVAWNTEVVTVLKRHVSLCSGFVFYASSIKTFIVHIKHVRLSRESLFYLCKHFSCVPKSGLYIDSVVVILILGPSSIQFSCSVMSDSLRPHGLQHARLPCPSPTPQAYSNSCPSCCWCHPTISSSVVPFSSHLQSFPASGSFQMSPFFPSGGQRVGVSASAPVLPMNIQDWFPLGWTGWIFLQSWPQSRMQKLAILFSLALPHSKWLVAFKGFCLVWFFCFVFVFVFCFWPSCMHS